MKAVTVLERRQAKKNEKFRSATKSDETDHSIKKGVILLSHIPRGFYEHQMMGFFSQFGEVTRLKLIRSKKTGGSRHFAFIEFRYEEVAKVAAETMNFYLMFKKVLRCKFIPSKEVNRGIFRRWKEIYVPPNNRKKQILAYNKAALDPEKIALRRKRALKKRNALQKQLKSLGIDYDVLNVKKNEAFVPPRRSRASPTDIQVLWKSGKVRDTDGRCSDFDYSDDEETKRIPSAGLSNDATIETVEVDLNDTEDSQLDANDFNVMVVDPDENEITFKTPPADAKILRKTLKKSKRQKMLLKLQQSLESDSEGT